MIDQAFWNHWLIERLRRDGDDGSDAVEQIKSELGNVRGNHLSR